MNNTAKIFTTGRSQAVRLPMEFRFDGKEVFIRRDPITGDVILSRKPDSWQGFFDVLANTEAPGDFMDDRKQTRSKRDPFAETDQ